MRGRLRDWFGDGSVVVLDIPLACCALESQAAAVGPVVGDLGADATLVVTLSGTITEAIAPAVRATIDEQPVKPVVVAFGACACIGGPYWDAYSVVKGAAELGIAVDHFVPGCPPPPSALDAVMEQVRRG